MTASHPSRRFKLPQLNLFHLAPIAIALHGLVLLIPVEAKKAEQKPPEKKEIQSIENLIALPPAAPPSPKPAALKLSPTPQKAASQPIATPVNATLVQQQPQVIERIVEKIVKQEPAPQPSAPAPPTPVASIPTTPTPVASTTPPPIVPEPVNPIAQALADAGIKAKPCSSQKGACQSVEITTIALSEQFKQLPGYEESANLKNDEDRVVGYAFRIKGELKYLYIDIEKGTGVATKFVLRTEQFKTPDEAFESMG